MHQKLGEKLWSKNSILGRISFFFKLFFSARNWIKSWTTEMLYKTTTANFFSHSLHPFVYFTCELWMWLVDVYTQIKRNSMKNAKYFVIHNSFSISMFSFLFDLFFCRVLLPLQCYIHWLSVSRCELPFLYGAWHRDGWRRRWRW